MFIIVPLSLILISLVGIVIIIWRRLSRSGNVYATGADSGTAFVAGQAFSWKSYGAELFPEIKVLLERLKLDEYKAMWLGEAEKLLRKSRLISLKVDRVSDSLIKKIRRVNLNSQIKGQGVAGESSKIKDNTSVIQDSHIQREISASFLKNEEQRLIMEIAKNPKNAELYEKLGDLYLEMEGFVDAKESYEAAIELNPQNESLKQKLSSALEKITPLS